MSIQRLRPLLLLTAAALAPLQGCVSDTPGTSIHDGRDPGGADASAEAGSCQPLSVTILSGGEVGSCATVRFTYAASGGTAAAGFECSLDGAPFLPCAAAGISYPGLTDGAHTFRVRARQSDGKLSAIAERGFVVDARPPAINLISPIPGTTTGGNVTFRFDVDAGATLACTLDGQALPECRSGMTLPALDLGKHELTLVAADACGNPVKAAIDWAVASDEEACGAMPYSCDWVPPGAPGCGTTVCGFFDPCRCVDGKWQPYPLDCFCPQLEVEITSGAEEGVGCPKTTFTYEVVAGTAFSYFVCWLDNTFFSHCPAEGMTFEGLTGTHVFMVAAVQNGGLSSPEVERVFTIDAQPPAVDVTAPTAGATTGASVTLRLTADADARLTCVLDGTLLGECRDGLALPSLSPGTHQLSVLAEDGCENESVETVTWTVSR